jgi:phosphopantothenoylcysteine synthetase/decarboxylase
MTGDAPQRVLYLVVCGAGPAADAGKLLVAAHATGWDTYVVVTPAAAAFLDRPAVEAQTGHPLRSAYRDPGMPRRSMPAADAVIVAPATYNTINKLAAGVSDNYALGVLAECIGARLPVVVLPFINAALASRAPLRAAVAALRAEGVRILLGDNGYQPHPAGEGAERIADFPWIAALNEAARLADIR